MLVLVGRTFAVSPSLSFTSLSLLSSILLQYKLYSASHLQLRFCQHLRIWRKYTKPVHQIQHSNNLHLHQSHFMFIVLTFLFFSGSKNSAFLNQFLIQMSVMFIHIEHTMRIASRNKDLLQIIFYQAFHFYNSKKMSN